MRFALLAGYISDLWNGSKKETLNNVILEDIFVLFYIEHFVFPSWLLESS